MPLYAQINGAGPVYQVHGTATLTNYTPPDPPPPPPGLPSETGIEFTPAMTGPSCNGWVASATSEYSEGGVTASAWKALNGAADASWQNLWSSAGQATAQAPKIWTLQAPSAHATYRVRLKSRTDVGTLAPTAFQIRDADGTVMVEASGLSWSASEEKTFICSTPKLTDRWDIVCTASGALCQIAQVRLFS